MHDGPTVDSSIDRGQIEDVPWIAADPAKQALDLAEAITRDVWAAVGDLIESSSNSADVKRQLACHTWCDLFICMARAIEEARSSIALFPDFVKERVKVLLKASSMKGLRPLVTARIVDFLVDKAWDALKDFAVSHFPVVTLVTGEGLLRSLRILAYLSCPNPDEHRDVRDHALTPLESQTRDMLTDETKERLRAAFVSELHIEELGESA